MSSFTFYNDQSMNNLNVNQLSVSSLTTGELIVVNNLIISGDLAVNGGAITSTAATFELLSTSDGAAAATVPTTINIGSVTAGPLVTTNIQSQRNTIGQPAFGQLSTQAALSAIGFNSAAGGGVGLGTLFFMEATGSTLIGTIASGVMGVQRPLALSSYTGLAVAALAINNSTASATINAVNTSDYTGGGGVATCNLPVAQAGAVVIYDQALVYTDVNAVTFNCAGNDIFALGSLAPNPPAIGVWDVSTAGETALSFTPAAATSNLFDAGSIIEFQCVNVRPGAIGTWFVNIIAVPGATATTGTFAWAA